MSRLAEPLLEKSIISGTSVKKRRTPLVRDLTYYQEQGLSRSPRFTETDASHHPTSAHREMPERSDLKHDQQASTLQQTHSQVKAECTSRCRSTHARKDLLQQLVSVAGISQLHASSLTEWLWRALSPNDKVVKVKLSKVASVLEVAAQNGKNKARSMKLMKQIVEAYLKEEKITYNKLTLHSHLSELYELLAQIHEPGIGMLCSRFKPYMEGNKENQPNCQRSANKFEQLFAQSKSRSIRKQQREHQRILKQVQAQNNDERTTSYQQALRLFQNTLYTSKQSEDRNKSSRKTPTKPSKQPNIAKYSKLHADRAFNKQQHQPRSSVLFQLNIRINNEVANVQIRQGQTPLDVVDKLRAEFEVSCDLQLQLTGMIQQYMQQHCAQNSSL